MSTPGSYLRMQRINWVQEEIDALFQIFPELTYSDVQAFNAAGWDIMRFTTHESIVTTIHLVESDLEDAWHIACRLSNRRKS